MRAMLVDMSYMMVPEKVAKLKSVEQFLAEQAFVDQKRIQDNVWLDNMIMLNQAELCYHANILTEMHAIAERKVMELEHQVMLAELNDAQMQLVFLHYAVVSSAEVGLYSNQDVVSEVDAQLHKIDADIAVVQRQMDVLVAKMAEKEAVLKPQLEQERDDAISDDLDQAVDALNPMIERLLALEAKKAVVDNKIDKLSEKLEEFEKYCKEDMARGLSGKFYAMRAQTVSSELDSLYEASAVLLKQITAMHQEIYAQGYNDARNSASTRTKVCEQKLADAMQPEKEALDEHKKTVEQLAQMKRLAQENIPSPKNTLLKND